MIVCQQKKISRAPWSVTGSPALLVLILSRGRAKRFNIASTSGTLENKKAGLAICARPAKSGVA
jgi:hypothetical protein